MSTKRFPWLRTIYDEGSTHPFIAVTFREGEQELRFCGRSWCTGECGMPAAVLADSNGELKMFSAMTACGPVMQPWRVKWTGQKYVITDEFREKLMAAYWF